MNMRLEEFGELAMEGLRKKFTFDPATPVYTKEIEDYVNAELDKLKFNMKVTSTSEELAQGKLKFGFFLKTRGGFLDAG